MCLQLTIVMALRTAVWEALQLSGRIVVQTVVFQVITGVRQALVFKMLPVAFVRMFVTVVVLQVLVALGKGIHVLLIVVVIRCLVVVM